MAMSIKDHIEAGHYPKDDKGHAIVTIGNGERYAIVRFDNPGSPLVGLRIRPGDRWDGWQDWDENGRAGSGQTSFSILPPTPRKVEVKAWAILTPVGMILRDSTPAGVAGFERLIELTGSYEEPWE